MKRHSNTCPFCFFDFSWLDVTIVTAETHPKREVFGIYKVLQIKEQWLLEPPFQMQAPTLGI